MPPPSPAALRADLERLVCADLHGSAGGEQEELIERSVRDRYLVGMLAPRRQRVNLEEVDDLAERLTLSPYTVQSHVKAIFGKLGVKQPHCCHSRRARSGLAP